MSIITADVVDHTRAAKRAKTHTRQQRIAEAIDAFQSVVLEMNATLRPTYAQSIAVGRARKHLLAAIAAKDRSERPAS